MKKIGSVNTFLLAVYKVVYMVTKCKCGHTALEFSHEQYQQKN